MVIHMVRQGRLKDKSKARRQPTEQDISDCDGMEARAMTKFKIQMPNECQSPKSKMFGMGPWDFDLTFEMGVLAFPGRACTQGGHADRGN